MNYKICTKCGKNLAATTENFSRAKKGKYGLQAQCKQCRAKYDKKQGKIYREKNKDFIKAKNGNYYKTNQGEIIKKAINRANKKSEEIGINIRTLHKRMRKIKSKPVYCTICNEKKKMDLASINHSYTQNLEDWIWLCRSCHLTMDRISEVLNY